MKANILSLHTPTTPGVGSKGHFFFFSKSGHVAYPIKVEEVWFKHIVLPKYFSNGVGSQVLTTLVSTLPLHSIYTQ